MNNNTHTTTFTTTTTQRMRGGHTPQDNIVNIKMTVLNLNLLRNHTVTCLYVTSNSQIFIPPRGWWSHSHTRGDTREFLSCCSCRPWLYCFLRYTFLVLNSWYLHRCLSISHPLWTTSTTTVLQVLIIHTTDPCICCHNIYIYIVTKVQKYT